MFRLFNSWKTYPVSEIRAGKHLNEATSADARKFFDKHEFKNSCLWYILRIDDETVYWGKVKGAEVSKNQFFKTSRKEIEGNFEATDTASEKTKLDVINRHIRHHLDEIDGARYELLSSKYQSVALQDDGNFHFVISAEVNITPVTPNPETSKGEASFNITLRSHNFSLVNIKMAK